MKKFKCYKCGAVAAVEDSATRAVCPKCGTVCSFAPAAPAPVKAPQPAPQPQPAAQHVPQPVPQPQPAAQHVPQPAPQPQQQAYAPAPQQQAYAPVPQQQAYAPVPQQPQQQAYAPMAPQPMAQPQGMYRPQPAGPSAGVNTVAEYAERSAIVATLAPWCNPKDYRVLEQTIMTAPIDMARAALNVTLRSPRCATVCAFLFYLTGIDRIYAGYVALGVCKWLFGILTATIWNIVDLFYVTRYTRKKNFERIIAACGMAMPTAK